MRFPKNFLYNPKEKYLGTHYGNPEYPNTFHVPKLYGWTENRYLLITYTYTYIQNQIFFRIFLL